MPQSKDMVKLGLSEWSTELEQYTVISLWGKRELFQIKTSMPHLELIAAILSVKMAKFLGKELNIDCLQEMFLSDSKMVLGYIRNKSDISQRSSRYLLPAESSKFMKIVKSINGGMSQVKTIQLIMHLMV